MAASLPGDSSEAPELAAQWVRAGVAVIHLYADDIGKDMDGEGLPESLHQVHTHLVSLALRDQVTLVVSGGIAAAEHVAKAIACGADLVAVDFILQVAWGCSLWADRGKCHVESEELDPAWGAQRVVNLMNARPAAGGARGHGDARGAPFARGDRPHHLA
ncbi:MAG: glutamate synthase-related protein [Anaerolineales bacterium]